MKKKLSIIGFGRVGFEILKFLDKRFFDVKIVDIKESAKGTLLDFVENFNIEFSDDYEIIKDSDIVVLSCGLRRQKGLKREELLRSNLEIIKFISNKVSEFSPDALIVMLTTPAEILSYAFYRMTAWDKRKIISFSVEIDIKRFKNLIWKNVGLDADLYGFGSHADFLYIEPQSISFNGLSYKYFLSESEIKSFVETVKNWGDKILEYSGLSSFYTPGKLVADVLNKLAYGQKVLGSFGTIWNGEYGFHNFFACIPSLLSENFKIEKTFEIDISDEKDFFERMKSLKNLEIELEDIINE